MSKPSDPADIFAALGDRTRLGLLATLSSGGAHSITALSAQTALTRQAVTKHLQVLETAGLVERRRAGRESLYAYREEQLEAARVYLANVSARWDAALTRLKAFVGGKN